MSVAVVEETELKCGRCERPMRAHGTSLEQFPGTVMHHSRGLCHTCSEKPHEIGFRIGDDPAVPIRSLLRPSTFQVFERQAKRSGTTVGEMLSRLADAAVVRPPAPAVSAPEPVEAPADPEPIPSPQKPTRARKASVQLTDEQRLEVVRLRSKENLTHQQIADTFGVHYQTVRNILRDARTRGEVIA
ncbi:RNA polymerase sigma factor [Microbacterium trichothecenolyticum]|uniref:RNA polymerase sigma factor n=1 Tax=Microbacterium trichothecenolyticum TaxID=69370 RepID=UPI0035BE710B